MGNQTEASTGVFAGALVVVLLILCGPLLNRLLDNPSPTVLALLGSGLTTVISALMQLLLPADILARLKRPAMSEPKPLELPKER